MRCPRFLTLWLFSQVALPGRAAEFPSPPPLRAAATAQSSHETADWVRAGLNTNAPVWGLRGGLLWGLPAGGIPRDGPRGLIRLRYPVGANGTYDLINFIAIEPVVKRRKGFSELEWSQLDRMPGKRLWPVQPGASNYSVTNLYPGELVSAAAGRQMLVLRVGVERFENGAQVMLTLTQSSDAPGELDLVIHALPESEPIEYCILTATMGNKARVRQLWLKDAIINSRALYSEYRGSDFAPHKFFQLDRLHRDAAGDVLVAVTTDEANPAAVEPFPGRLHWRYQGVPVTQYWRKPAGLQSPRLHVAVNARHTYWRSSQPIPGGIAYENFELREPFCDGQRFIFGITRQSPNALGFPSPVP